LVLGMMEWRGWSSFHFARTIVFTYKWTLMYQLRGDRSTAFVNWTLPWGWKWGPAFPKRLDELLSKIV